MALSIKANAEDLPSIFQILGLGQPPPVDSSLAGAPPDLPDTSVSSQQSVPTKLGRLQQIIQASQGNTDSPAMTDQHNSPSVDPDTVSGQPSLSQVMAGPQPNDAQFVAAAEGTPPGSVPDAGPIVSRNMSQLPDVGEGAPVVTEHQTWAQQHPGLARILKIGLSAGEGALAGSQYANAGQGFMAAHELTDPIRKKMEDATLAEKQAATEHQKVATQQMGSQVTLPNGSTVPFALAQKLYPTLITEQGKNSRGQAALDSRESIAGDKNALALRKQGLKLDANGKQVPLGRDEMSESELATLDLKQSQQDATDARAELDRNKNNPNSPAYKAAMGRLAVAQRNADTAAGRLGIETKKYLGDYFGTDAQGNALPGAPTDDNGRPIGTRVANAGAASADRLKRGDLAANAIHNLNNIQEIVNRRPDLLGPLAGRYTNFIDMMGSDDPDIAALGVEGHNYGLASNGAHGVRSQQSVAATEQELLNHFRRGQTGATGAINAAKDSLGDFVADQKLGKRARPSGGANKPVNPQATHVYDQATGTIAPVGH